MGVAVSTSRSGRSPLAKKAALCFTPKRCCSSITQRERRANFVFAAKSAWVPTVILGKSPTGPGLEAEVHVTISTRRGGSSFRSATACCSTSKVVGAMSATCEPCSSALNRAWAATRVFPEPTSPWRRRCIGRPRLKSLSISLQTSF